MAPQLSNGALMRMISGEQVEKPVIQLLGYKRLPGNAERYRFLLSDGTNIYPVCMLATQLNNRLTNGELEKHTVVQLTRYTVTDQTGKKVIILVDMTVLLSGEAAGSRIGSPVPLNACLSSPLKTQVKTEEPEVEQKYRPPGSQPSTSHGASSSGLNNAIVNIHPISSLTPYQNKWTIKARVTNKSPVKTWSNSRGEGSFFSVDLIDESGEIRATAFKEQCDKFYDSIEVSKVYYFSKARLKTANKNFTSIKHPYEMTFSPETTVVLCNENTSNIPTLQFDFISIAQVEDAEKDQLIDVIGICKYFTEVQTITTRANNRECKKREVTLVDSSCADITLTLWDVEAERFNGAENPVVAVKGARVSDFGGRSLSTISSSVVQINPDIQETYLLRRWYDSEGAVLETQSITVKGPHTGVNGIWKTFAQVKAENPNNTDKPDYFSSKATVVMVKRDHCLYQSCPLSDCKKKVVDLGNGLYRCEKCSMEVDNFKWRLLLSVNLADFSDSLWATCFQETAEVILGTTAKELGRLKDTDEDRFNEMLNNANFKSFIFSLRTNVETYNDESRLKTVVYAANPVTSVQYGKKLLTDILSLEEIL